MKLKNVELQFTYDNTVVKAIVNEEGNWQQWGATTQELGENIDLIEQIAEKIIEKMDLI